MKSWERHQQGRVDRVIDLAWVDPFLQHQVEEVQGAVLK